MCCKSGSAAERKGKSASRIRVVVDTNERRDKNKEEREDAEGEEEVESKRVGASRIRWILRAGWEELREVRREVSAAWVEEIEESLR